MVRLDSKHFYPQSHLSCPSVSKEQGSTVTTAKTLLRISFKTLQGLDVTGESSKMVL